MAQKAHGMDITFPRSCPVFHFTPRVLENTTETKKRQLDGLVCSLDRTLPEQRVQSLLVAKFDTLCADAQKTQNEASMSGLTYPWGALSANGLPNASQP